MPKLRSTTFPKIVESSHSTKSNSKGFENRRIGSGFRSIDQVSVVMMSTMMSNEDMVEKIARNLGFFMLHDYKPQNTWVLRDINVTFI